MSAYINKTVLQALGEGKKMNMEELKQTALAYYEKLSDQQKIIAADMFRDMDANGDGRISYQEYNQFLVRNGLSCIDSNGSVFEALDGNRDGYLNFEEFLTLHYIRVADRIILCNGCGSFLTGVYFSCYQCFWSSASGNSYDLCCQCYRSNNNFNHHSDAVFLDNYTILRSKWRQHHSAMPPPSHPYHSASFSHRPAPPPVTSSRSQHRSLSMGSGRRSNWIQTVFLPFQVLQAVNSVESFVGGTGPNLMGSITDVADICTQM